MNRAQNKAVLTVSFGTSHADTREKNIDRIEADLARAFPEYAFYRAWTSGMIRRILRERDGVSVDSVAQAMRRMKDDGIREVLVQPTHVMDAIENEAMRREVEAARAAFDEVRIGEPLLVSAQDYHEAAQALTEEWAHLPREEALVLMGHGTEHPRNDVYTRLSGVLKEKGCRHIFLGTVEAQPGLEELLPLVRENAPEKIHLAPFMIVAGDHAKNDMSGGDDDSWASRFAKEGYQVECHLKGLGEYGGIRKIFVRHAREAK